MVPGDNNFVNRGEFFAEILNFFNVRVIWQVHQIDSSGEQRRLLPFWLSSFFYVWSCTANKVINSVVVKLKDSIFSLLLSLVLYDNFAWILAQRVLYQIDLLHISNDAESVRDLVLVPILRQIRHENLLGREQPHLIVNEWPLLQYQFGEHLWYNWMVLNILIILRSSC